MNKISEDLMRCLRTFARPTASSFERTSRRRGPERLLSVQRSSDLQKRSESPCRLHLGDVRNDSCALDPHGAILTARSCRNLKRKPRALKSMNATRLVDGHCQDGTAFTG